MAGLFREYIWPIVLIFLSGLLDIILRNFTSDKLKFLTKPFFNLIEILVLVLLILYLNKFIPAAYKKKRNQARATGFRDDWREFKYILAQYIKSNEDCQKRYEVLRNKIREDFNYFLIDIEGILKKENDRELNIVLNNFQKCFEPAELKEWSAKVGREVPRELDCFDYIPAALVRYFDK